MRTRVEADSFRAQAFTVSFRYAVAKALTLKHLIIRNSGKELGVHPIFETNSSSKTEY